MSVPPYFYETNVTWKGARKATLRSPGLPPLEASTPPEFKGEAGTWTPEHLYVAAAELCLMATFVGIAEIARVPVAAYRSSARGRLEKVEGNGLQFTEIAIEPVIELERIEDIPRAESVMAKAEKGCLVANSMRTKIRIEPLFVQKAAKVA